MVLAATVLVGALLASLLAPRALRLVEARSSDPALGMVSWMLALASVIATAAFGLTLVLLPGHGGLVVASALYECWDSVRHGGVPRLDQAAGAAGTLAAVVAIARSGWAAGRAARQRRRRTRERLEALALIGQADAEGTVWIPSSRPAAFCLSGQRRLVVATTALHHLPNSACEAVLAHERAHLAGRHHLLLAMVDAICAGAPRLPLFRDAPVAVRELAELAADRSASRRCGATAVKQALLAVSGCSTPPGALAMRSPASVAGRLAALDRHLIDRPVRAARARRSLRRVVTTSAAVLLPVAGAGLLASVVALLSCS